MLEQAFISKVCVQFYVIFIFLFVSCHSQSRLSTLLFEKIFVYALDKSIFGPLNRQRESGVAEI